MVFDSHLTYVIYIILSEMPWRCPWIKKGILKNLIYLAHVNSSVPMGFLKNSDSLGLAISNIYNLLYI